MTAGVVLITGCSSGIGRATAEAFLDDGWRVWATSRDPDDVADLDDAGCRTAALDVTDDRQIESVAEQLLDAEGRIDCLVNNAGYGQEGAVEDVPVDRVRDQFEVNVFGVVRLTRALLPTMRSQRSGTVVNVSSLLGRIAYPMRGVYAGSKFALEGLSDALRRELDGFGVDVVLVEPGTVDTDFDDRASETTGGIDTGASPYSRGYTLVGGAQRLFARFGIPPERVAETIHRAATADRPSPRFVVGTDAKVLLLLRCLPTRLQDWLFSKAVR
jgi:NAD(P)-dependent dehydrogenase (short-subunit alcohol dehydrogenase family)